MRNGQGVGWRAQGRRGVIGALLWSALGACAPEGREQEPARDPDGAALLLRSRQAQKAPLQFGVAVPLAAQLGSAHARFGFSLGGLAHVHVAASPAAGGRAPELELFRLGDGRPRSMARSARGLRSRSAELDAVLDVGVYELRVRPSQPRDALLVEASCTGVGCPQEEHSCLFGDTFNDRASLPGLELVDQAWFYGANDLPDALSAAQVVAAVQQSSHTDVRSAEEALARVDQGEIRRVRFRARAGEAEYVAWEYGAGDNSYGAYFAAHDSAVLASIHDGDVLDCTVAQ